MQSIIFALLLATGFGTNVFKQESKCVENINPDCFCILIFDPVCGCNNQTYGNACQAACAGIPKVKKGECKK